MLRNVKDVSEFVLSKAVGSNLLESFVVAGETGAVELNVAIAVST